MKDPELVSISPATVGTMAVFVITYDGNEGELIKLPVCAWGLYRYSGAAGGGADVEALVTTYTDESSELTTPGDFCRLYHEAEFLGLYHEDPIDEPEFKLTLARALDSLRERRAKVS